MRAEIRQLLIAGVPDVEGRVFEPHAADLQTPKPFLVVREGVQDAEAEGWSAFSQLVEVWPHAARESFVTVDSLAQQVIDTLHRTRFAVGAEQFLAFYLGSAGQDVQDDAWDALTRGLRFRVFALGWLAGLTYNPDPVATLRAWTTATWPEVRTDPATWMPTDATPGIYWRLVTVSPIELTNWGFWADAGLRAHVLAPSPATRLTWTRRLAEALALQRRLMLADDSPLTFQAVAADSEADPMRVGQVRLTARFGVLRDEPGEVIPPPPPGTPLNVATVGGDVHGEVRAE